MLTRQRMLDGEPSCQVQRGTFGATERTALVTDLVELVAVLGVSVERVLHRRDYGRHLHCGQRRYQKMQHDPKAADEAIWDGIHI